MFGPPGCLGLQLQKGVDVACKEPSIRVIWVIGAPLVIVPDTGDLQQFVAHFEGFVDLRGAPGPTQCSLLDRMSAVLMLASVSTSGAQWEGELPP